MLSKQAHSHLAYDFSDSIAINLHDDRVPYTTLHANYFLDVPNKV